MTTETTTEMIETGCYVDGSHGWRGIAWMLTRFDGVYYTLSDSERDDIALYVQGVDNTDLMESVIDMADQYLDEMNSRIGPDYMAGWCDGEFYILATDQWPWD